MLKNAASFVLASLRGSPYSPRVRFASSLAVAALDGLFEHPVRTSLPVRDTGRFAISRLLESLFNSLLEGRDTFEKFFEGPYEVIMAVESVMLPLGTIAPDFELPDVMSGQMYNLQSFAGKSTLLVMFICRHCPYVVHVQDEIAKLGRDYADSGLGIVAISSNDPGHYPDDAPERLKDMAQRLGFSFPFCFDETQDVAKAYRAACTPDFYLFDGERRLVYRGQLDDSRPGTNKPVTGRDLRTAIDAVLAGKPVSSIQRASIGCSIKWKAGNVPGYA